MYFLKGALPWQGMRINKNEDRYKKIYDKKLSTSSEELCRGYPSNNISNNIEEFAEYMDYSRTLKYEHDPDYEYLKNLFTHVLKENKFENDYHYDWVKKNNSPKTHSTMVPNNEILNNINNENNDFKLNLSIDKKKITLKGDTVNPSDIKVSYTNNIKKINDNSHKKVTLNDINNENDDIQINVKCNVNNNNEQAASNLFNNTPRNNSIKDIE